MQGAFAAIDVGSSAIRLSMVRLSAAGVAIEDRFHRYSLRLGADVYAHGHIQDTTELALLDVFRDIQLRMNHFGVNGYRAIATAALRDASNGVRVADRIYQKYGVNLEVISGEEESTLSRSALVRALGFVEPSTLLVDLGGGSLELVAAGSGRGLSLPLGTVRLLERFPELTGPVTPSYLERAQAAVLGALEPARSLLGNAPLAIGTGGNFSVLARVLPEQVGMWPAICLKDVEGFVVRVSQMDCDARMASFGVRPDRADILLPTAIVLATLRTASSLSALVVPGTGLREAILQRLAMESDRELKAPTMLERAGVGADAAKRRANWAITLFQTLAPIHGLWPSALEALELAAFGQELGCAVNKEDPVRHGSYMIRHASELDADATTRAIAAAAFRHSRGARSTLRGFGREDQRATRILGAILELAGTVDPSAKPEDLKADLTGAHLWLALGIATRAQRRWHRLERALGRRLRVS